MILLQSKMILSMLLECRIVLKKNTPCCLGSQSDNRWMVNFISKNNFLQTFIHYGIPSQLLRFRDKLQYFLFVNSQISYTKIPESYAKIINFRQYWGARDHACKVPYRL